MPPQIANAAGRRRARPLAAPLLVALLLALALAACDSKESAASAAAEQPAPSAASAPPEAVPAQAGPLAVQRTRTPVSTLRLEPRTFTLSATYIGHLLPRERVELRTEIDGVSESVRFEEGDAVRRGQSLANISTEQMRLRRDQAKADLALAESTYERNRALHAKKLVTDAVLDQSRTRRELAEFTHRLSELELAKSEVISPIDGIVKTRGVDRGEFHNKGRLIAEILDIAQVKALFNVPERELRYLHKGRPVQVTFEALPERAFPGVVRLVGLEADLKTRTFPVEVTLDNPLQELRPGMLARVTVALERYTNQLMVPRHAVLERERGRVVYLVESGEAREREIVTGASADGQVQVLQGLAPGDVLVVAGQQKLTPGEPVEVYQIPR